MEFIELQYDYKKQTQTGGILIKELIKRIDKLEQLIQDKKGYTIILAIYSDKDKKYIIQYIDKGIKSQFMYDKMQDFYRDKNINTRDKHTFIKVYHEFKAEEV